MAYYVDLIALFAIHFKHIYNIFKSAYYVINIDKVFLCKNACYIDVFSIDNSFNLCEFKFEFKCFARLISVNKADFLFYQLSESYRHMNL